MDQFDKDGDGTLDKDELREAFFQNGKSFKTLYDAVDEDGNGELDKEEMGRFFSMTGRSQLDNNKLFRDFDVNGDGKISFSEFNEWLKKELIKKTFNVKQCEQATSNVQREFGDKAKKHKDVLEKMQVAHKQIAQIEEEERPIQAKREAVALAVIEKKREAAKLRQQIEMISLEMHKQHALMKKTMPGGRTVSNIYLTQLGKSGPHHQSYAQLPRPRKMKMSSSVHSRSSPLMKAGLASLGR